MKALVIIFIIVSVLVASALLTLAIKDLIDEYKKNKQLKSAQGKRTSASNGTPSPRKEQQ